MRIATLGWGSVLWDKRPEFAEFNRQHGEWLFDGPTLRLEFSRISASRSKALTLVIDGEFGSPCQVAYSTSRRTNLNDAIRDLNTREGSPGTHKIGFCRRDGKEPRARDKNALQCIRDWLKAKPLEAVVWTDLESNFSPRFSVGAAFAHLIELDLRGKQIAAEYVRKAPGFVRTPLRTALELRGHADHDFTHEEISVAAYFIRENANCALGFESHGHDREDWFAAKNELRQSIAWSERQFATR